MEITYLSFVMGMFLFGHIFEAIFATKNNRTPHIINFANFCDLAFFLIGLTYIFIVYKDFRLNTWLNGYNELELADAYWNNYLRSPWNEPMILTTYGLFLWLRCFYQLKLISFSGPLFAVLERMVKEVVTFGIFYVAQLFLFAVVGTVLF